MPIEHHYQASHENKYKNKALTGEELRRRREETAVQLRKEKREQQLTKRRNVSLGPDDDFDQEFEGTSANQITAQMVQNLASDDPMAQHEATVMFRKLLSREPNPPIDAVINSGVVDRLVHLLQQAQVPAVQFEAAWVLTNIASGTQQQTASVVDAGAVPAFVQLLNSNNQELVEQAVWALGNIAGDSPPCRNYALDLGVMPPLVEIVNCTPKISMLRNAVWAVSNLCRGKNPPPDFEKVSVALPALAKRLFEEDADVLSDVCWSLSYLSDGPNHRIQTIIQAGVCRRLVELLMHSHQQVVSAALRAVGNIVTGDDQQTEVVITCGALPCLNYLLSHPSEMLRKESCWTISNITAGNQSQIQAVIDANIVPNLVHVLDKAEFRTRKEAAWAITNAVSGGSDAQVRYIVHQQCIPPLCDLLTVMDARIIQVALNGIENILRVGELDQALSSVNPYAQLVEECYGVDKIEFLQNHENSEIYVKAFELIEKYFSDDGLQDSTSLAPDVASDNQSFVFEVPALSADSAQMAATAFQF